MNRFRVSLAGKNDDLKAIDKILEVLYSWKNEQGEKAPEVERSNYDDGGMPSEGILVEDLPKENLEKKDVRCLDCNEFSSQKNPCYMRRIDQTLGKSVASAKTFSPLTRDI